MNRRIYDEKRNYIACLSNLLATDPRSGVKHVCYEPPDSGGEEHARVTFENGTVVAVCITGDSCSGIYKDVGKAIYGL